MTASDFWMRKPVTNSGASTLGCYLIQLSGRPIEASTLSIAIVVNVRITLQLRLDYTLSDRSAYIDKLSNKWLQNSIVMT